MNIKSTLQRVAFLAVFCLAPLAYADTLTLVGGGPTFAGEQVGPYTVRINGGPIVQAICDDFHTNSYIGSSWTATRYDYSDLSGAKFWNAGAGLNNYLAAARLANALLSATTTQDRGRLQFAIWEIFDTGASPEPFSRLSVDDRNAATQLKNDAFIGLTGTEGDGWSVYTPSPFGASQEFLVKTPETSAAALLGFNLSAMIGLVFVFRRRIIGVSN